MEADAQPLMRPLRVGIVGARRVRQGTGPYLARFLAAEGANVVGVVGTSLATAIDAARTLAAEGIDTTPYPDAAALVREGRLDALVIASPHETHDEYLTLAARAGLHVLCEKPLCWGGSDPAGRARRHAGALLAQRRHLMLQTQWPYTLAGYERLFPGVLASGWTRFSMHLGPGSRGKRMVSDAAPHALSLLAACVPDSSAAVVDPTIEVAPGDDGRAVVRFDYCAADRRIECELRLDHTPRAPRRASYGFDGHLARREIEPATYHMTLAGGGSKVALPDPTPLLVRAFVSRVRSGESPSVDPGAVPGVAHLVQLASAWGASPC